MCGLRTRPRTDIAADGRRSAAIFWSALPSAGAYRLAAPEAMPSVCVVFTPVYAWLMRRWRFQMQKKQDHILWTLESKKIDHEQIDIGDPNREKDREFMRENAAETCKTTVLPPQIFNDETYIGVRTHRLPPSRGRQPPSRILAEVAVKPPKNFCG